MLRARGARSHTPWRIFMCRGIRFLQMNVIVKPALLAFIPSARQSV